MRRLRRDRRDETVTILLSWSPARLLVEVGDQDRPLTDELTTHTLVDLFSAPPPRPSILDFLA